MPSGVFGTLTNNEWKILPEIGEEIETMTGTSGKGYVYYKFWIEVERQSTAYCINYVALISALTLLSSFTLLMERSLSARLGNVMTILLTQSALKIVLAGSVPMVSYLTAMDKFIVASFLLVAGTGIQSALVERLIDDEDVADRVDLMCFYVYLGIWALTHLEPMLYAGMFSSTASPQLEPKRPTPSYQASTRAL